MITGHLLRPPPVVDDDYRAGAATRPSRSSRMGQALPLYGNASQTLHTVAPG